MQGGTWIWLGGRGSGRGWLIVHTKREVCVKATILVKAKNAGCCQGAGKEGAEGGERRLVSKSSSHLSPCLEPLVLAQVKQQCVESQVLR